MEIGGGSVELVLWCRTPARPCGLLSPVRVPTRRGERAPQAAASRLNSSCNSASTKSWPPQPQPVEPLRSSAPHRCEYGGLQADWSCKLHRRHPASKSPQQQGAASVSSFPNPRSFLRSAAKTPWIATLNLPRLSKARFLHLYKPISVYNSYCDLVTRNISCEVSGIYSLDGFIDAFLPISTFVPEAPSRHAHQRYPLSITPLLDLILAVICSTQASWMCRTCTRPINPQSTRPSYLSLIDQHRWRLRTWCHSINASNNRRSSQFNEQIPRLCSERDENDKELRTV